MAPSIVIQSTYDKETSQFLQISDNPYAIPKLAQFASDHSMVNWCLVVRYQYHPRVYSIVANNPSGLRAAIQRYLDAQPANEFWQNFNPKSCSWNQVIQELDNAEEQYAAQGRNNPIRKALRQGSGISRNLKPLLEGVPQENGLGLLKGGLQIIFNAVKTRSDTCERIFEAFEGIPGSVIRAENLRRIFPRDEALATAFRQLNYELVKCIPEMIDVLLRKNHKSSEPFSIFQYQYLRMVVLIRMQEIHRLGKTVFGDSLRDINAILKPMEDAERDLEQIRAELITSGIANIQELSEEAKQAIARIQQSVDNADQRFKEEIGLLNSKIDKIDEKMDQERRNCIPQGTAQHVTQGMSCLFIFVQENRRIEYLHPEEADRVMISKRSRYAWEEFIDAICMEEERLSPIQDLGLVLRKYHEFSTKALAQANYLIMKPRFQSWLMDPESDIILVDGHCSETIGKIAPTSIFCAGLVETLSGKNQGSQPWALPQKPQAVLYFFAGEHTSPSSRLLGPQGMIRSLVDQLLLQWPRHDLPDLRFLEGRLMQLAGERRLDPQNLCHIFEKLIAQLGPKSPVWCIVDGISFFETSLHGWMDDLMLIIRSFLRCVTDTRGRNGVGQVKFLLISPDKSTVVRDSIPANYRVELRAGNIHS
ncbi:hypothetical protein FALBO_15630 [Fusarium albosuccineum]|uniref:Nephrocystin 3-like N-terminal domain-containing protein n=1 Tax=Fusarium albosuccineum TaxID=1237068 RepID=A0A8H4P339_9HYPO|nr:hypothetical protein FALBO_15630 [Fusarium albosuccineum]